MIAATVSGTGGIDRRMTDGTGAAMSYAITCAHQCPEPEGTWYVRDHSGETVARVEKLAGGQTLVFGAVMIRAEHKRTPFVPTA